MKKIFVWFLFAAFLNVNLMCFANNLSEGVQVNLSQVPLSSKLKKSYNGYKYVITNTSNQNLDIVNAQILNAVNGSVAYQDVSDGHPIGTTWAIAGPVGLFTFGIGWLAGIVATPIVWIVSDSKNKKAQRESIAYPNIINLGVLTKGDSIEADFLVPIGAKPQLKMIVQQEKTKELVHVNL